MLDGRSDGRVEIKRCYAGLGERRRIAERESELFFAPFARSSATPSDCFVSTATAPHASSCHDRRRGGSVGSSLPFFRRARILTRRAPRATLSRVSIRARYARTSGTFRFLPSPLHPYAVNRCTIVDSG